MSDRQYRLWTALILNADDEGRLVADAEQLRALVWGYHLRVTAAHVEDALAVLAKAGLAQVYSVRAVRYAVLPSWHDHQRIDRPMPSKLPPPPVGGEFGEFVEDSPNAPRRLDEFSSRARAGSEGIGSEGIGAHLAPAVAGAVVGPVHVDRQSGTVVVKPHPIRDLLTAYEARFEAKAGAKPVITGKDAKLAEGILRVMSVADARTLLQRFFTSADPFILKSGYSFGVFFSQVNKLLVYGNGPGPRLSSKTVQNLHAVRDAIASFAAKHQAELTERP